MRNLLTRIAFRFGTKWIVIAIAFINFLFSSAFIRSFLPSQAAIANTTLGYEVPDAAVGITQHDLYKLLEVYGADGRQQYKTLAAVDFLYCMISYNIFLTVLTVKMLSVCGFNYTPAVSKETAYYLLLIPSLIHLFDIFEGIFILLVIRDYPTQHALYFNVFWYSMHLKWLILLIDAVSILVGFAAGIIRRFALPKAARATQ